MPRPQPPSATSTPDAPLQRCPPSRARIRAKENGTTAVVLSIDQRGAMAGIAGLFTSKLTAKYLAMEAEGLKCRCEA